MAVRDWFATAPAVGTKYPFMGKNPTIPQPVFSQGGIQAGGPMGGGGGNPYGGILNEFLNSSKARFAGQSAADAAGRDASIRRHIISYGQVPDFSKLGISDQARGFLNSALNDKTTQLANQNTAEGTSVYARQARANDVANRRVVASNAGRGLLRSGQTGSDLGDQAQAYKNQSFDTLNELLGGVEGTVGNFLAAERQRADALAQAQLQAQMAAMQQWAGSMYGQYSPSLFTGSSPGVNVNDLFASGSGDAARLATQLRSIGTNTGSNLRAWGPGPNLSQQGGGYFG